MKIFLKPKHEKQVLKGYPWIFANQVARIEGSARRGQIAHVFSSKKQPLGQGFFHDTSLIAVRLLTADANLEIDAHFFKQRFLEAKQLRESVFGDETHYRLIFSESDGFPGTIIDRYQDVFTWTCLSYGMEQWRDVVLDCIEQEYAPRSIVERNDVELRAKDELVNQTGILRGTDPGKVEISENGVKFYIDPLRGPKTGYFMDQRLHRKSTATFAKGKKVLDVCCADGGFGLQAAYSGAKSVHFIDRSASALERVKANANASDIHVPITLDEADALDRIEQLHNEGVTYDLIVLDPPGFAKSRRHIETATRAYQRLNIGALRLLSEKGILATSSCSQAIKEADFLKIVRYAARKANLPLKVLFRGYQPPDHPILDAMPETHYLKFFIFQKSWT